MGVSNRAKRNLKRYPFRNSSQKLSQGKTSKLQSRAKTVAVSTICEVKVLKLFLIQRCLPLVIFLKKWKICTSINWAKRYAAKEAPTAIKVKPNTFLNSESEIGDHSVAVAPVETTIISRANADANNPAKTTLLAAFFPNISEMMSVMRNVIG